MAEWLKSLGSTCPGHALTHWGRETHICVGKLTIIASDNGLPPGRRQAIIWSNAGILLIGPLGTNFNEILIEIHTLSFKKMHLKMSSAKWRPFCLAPNVLMWSPGLAEQAAQWTTGWAAEWVLRDHGGTGVHYWRHDNWASSSDQLFCITQLS